jgi:hypothetical protein
MPRKPVERPLRLPVRSNAIKRDEIASRQRHALKQHSTGKLRTRDVKETMKDFA